MCNVEKEVLEILQEINELRSKENIDITINFKANTENIDNILQQVNELRSKDAIDVAVNFKGNVEDLEKAITSTQKFKEDSKFVSKVKNGKISLINNALLFNSIFPFFKTKWISKFCIFSLNSEHKQTNLIFLSSNIPIFRSKRRSSFIIKALSATKPKAVSNVLKSGEV